MGAQVALDWRSGARSTLGDPGWVKINGELQYRWLDRFMTGQLAMFRHSLNDGTTNTGLSWGHSQDFSQNTHLRADVNYVTNTFVQRTTAFNPASVLANIQSRASYDTKIGPAALSLGASRTQHPGRTQVEQGFPSLNITVPTISPVSWFDWSPGFSFNTDQVLNRDDAGEFQYQYITTATGQKDSVRRIRNQRTTSSHFETPIRIGGFTWSNSFSLNDQDFDAPSTVIVHDVNDSSVRIPTVFAKTFLTTVDWQTGINLPSFLQSSLKVTPSLAFVNVDGGPFWVRTQLTGGTLVHQSKRATFGLSSSPTLFALFPGFGPVSRFRHSITPIISYSYAPAGTISDEFLRAQNKTRQGYLGAIAQNRVSVGLSHVLEAKLKSTDTSSTAEPRKLKVLSMNLTTPLAYDFERARVTHRSGFATDNIGSDLSTDLLPGFHGGFEYSLYQGDILSDTARFKPFRTRIDAGLSLNSQSGIFGAIGKLFGRGAPPTNPQTGTGGNPDDALVRNSATPPVAGISSRNRQFEIPETQGWSASLQYSWSRQRPPTGNAIIIDNDPKAKCAPFIANPIVYQQCVQLASANPDGGVPFQSATSGGAFIRTPPRNNLDGSVNFHLTPMWAGTWRTNYDFEAHKFGSHSVTLQRQLHDWRAIFSFTQASNGNFAFTFFISLIAEPDLKFNYDKSTYRPVAP
jgi:hypothetical protein